VRELVQNDLTVESCCDEVLQAAAAAAVCDCRVTGEFPARTGSSPAGRLKVKREWWVD